MKYLVILSLVVTGGILFCSLDDASACHDNWDEIIVKLKAVDLTKVQMDQVFGMQKDLARLRSEDHRKGFSCSRHEVHVKAYEQTAIGLLDGNQFKKYTGRSRTEVEKLRKEVGELKAEVAELKKAIQELKAAIKK
ncbi:MAG: hypothetical protein O7H41_12290 [Planctomycetota bacterium]|nr:hypothetical protein [Planctomycetota bacterium]